MTIRQTILIIILIILVIFTCGCFNFFETHDVADKINVDYVKSGYYYFEDINGRSFNKTLWDGDFSIVPQKFTPNQWITYVQNLKYIADGENPEDEIFYNASETIGRGGGDCEDLAILMARGLHEFGFNTSIIVQETHVLAGINIDQVDNKYQNIRRNCNDERTKTYKNVKVAGYYPIECTAKWGIGEFDEKPIKYEKIYILN